MAFLADVKQNNDICFRGDIWKMDLRLYSNRTMVVCGPSHAGKSSFVIELLDRRHEFFRDVPKRIVWCYGIYQHEFIRQLHEKGFETHRDIISESQIRPHDIIVLDDLLHESKNSQDVTTMFTRAAHHKPCFIIFIMQNLFPPGKEARTRSLNTHYYVIFKNPRDKSQIEYLARQISPHNSKGLISAFESATEKTHSYLFLDLTQECPDHLRYRSNIFQRVWNIYNVGAK